MSAAIILGAGDGLGGALAERFAAGGHHAVLVRRDLAKAEAMAAEILRQGGVASGRDADVRDPDAMAELFRAVEADIGPVEVCIYNAGANTKKPLLETSPKLFRQVWELASFGGFLAAKESAAVMSKRGRGTLIFTSATSGIYGRTGFAAFASAKFALRGLAQAAAREFGPLGVHVAHVIIDCGIRTEAIRKRYAARDIDMDALDEDALARPESIAEQYWMLAGQPRDAWTHELDLRPFAEPW